MPERRFSGERLRERREAALLSQRELASKAGVSHVTIARLESNDDQAPQFRTIRKLSEALGVAAGELFVTETERGELAA